MIVANALHVALKRGWYSWHSTAPTRTPTATRHPRLLSREYRREDVGVSVQLPTSLVSQWCCDVRSVLPVCPFVTGILHYGRVRVSAINTTHVRLNGVFIRRPWSV